MSEIYTSGEPPRPPQRPGHARRAVRARQAPRARAARSPPRPATAATRSRSAAAGTRAATCCPRRSGASSRRTSIPTRPRPTPSSAATADEALRRAPPASSTRLAGRVLRRRPAAPRAAPRRLSGPARAAASPEARAPAASRRRARSSIEPNLFHPVGRGPRGRQPVRASGCACTARPTTSRCRRGGCSRRRARPAWCPSCTRSATRGGACRCAPQRAVGALDRFGSAPGARWLGHTFMVIARRPG